jgi:hypothetical protein
MTSNVNMANSTGPEDRITEPEDRITGVFFDSSISRLQEIGPEYTGNTFPLIFKEPSKRMPYETKSKFLEEDSDLYFFIRDAQDRLKYNGIRLTDKMDICVRILDDNEYSNSNKSASFELFKKRVKSLNKTNIYYEDIQLYRVCGKQLHLIIPGEFEGRTYHIVIGTFNTLAPRVSKFYNIIFNKTYDPSKYKILVIYYEIHN